MSLTESCCPVTYLDGPCMNNDCSGAVCASGLGIHYCLGAALARMEGRVAMEQALAHLPEVRLAAPVDALRWHTHPIMRGLHHLPVAWGKG